MGKSANVASPAVGRASALKTLYRGVAALHRDGYRASTDAINGRFALFTLLIFGMLLDAVTTAHLLASGKGAEANPFAAYGMALIGTYPFIILITLAAAYVLVPLACARPRSWEERTVPVVALFLCLVKLVVGALNLSLIFTV